ncbi:HAMP domain-containing sensor histidine kinase [uncultured Shewanella sp.]|uniref:sensor histidine kinase n=1 Tax=Shewanella atlantica TaxID=271099 RepID=UPI00260E9F94|nr:HAMP domain-containing sensor histidine kinase [uncultured Shewanella sp.]
MKPKLSLKRVYQVYGLCFLAITLIINSFIPLCMMCTGMFSMHEITMRNAAQAAELYTSPRNNAFQTDNITVFTSWDSVPDRVKAINGGVAPGEPQNVKHQHTNGKFIDALMLHQGKDGQQSYVWLHYNATHDLEFAPKNMAAICLLVIMTFTVNAILAWYLQSRVISPVHQISRAIKQHDWQKMQQLRFPKQCYAELQSIVDALDSSIKQLKEAQQRELSFLRFASHELRTPIAICQSSFDILTLEQGHLTGPTLHASQATTQMKSITETLLWLMSSDCSPMDSSNVKLSNLLNRIVYDQKYAQGSDVPVELKCDETELFVLKEPLTIVLNNLVRNSLEHGAKGISIVQSGNRIDIVNPLSKHNSSGFGLGLMLVERLAKQLNWHYSISNDHDSFRATLIIRPT